MFSPPYIFLNILTIKNSLDDLCLVACKLLTYKPNGGGNYSLITIDVNNEILCTRNFLQPFGKQLI